MTVRQVGILKIAVPILLGLLAVAVAWGAYGARLSTTEDKVAENSNHIRDLERAIPRIDANIEWIRLTLEEMTE